MDLDEVKDPVAKEQLIGQALDKKIERRIINEERKVTPVLAGSTGIVGATIKKERSLIAVIGDEVGHVSNLSSRSFFTMVLTGNHDDHLGYDYGLPTRWYRTSG
jgi:hypothetical protein